MTSIRLCTILLFLLLVCQNLLADSTKSPIQTDFQPLTQQALATYPLYRGDESYYGGHGDTLFSHNSRLFIFLERYEDSLTVIKIWDTLTGELKYQIAAPTEFPLQYDQVFHMQLSPDGTMLTLQMSEGHPEPFYTWKFTAMNKLEKTCGDVSARSWVKDFSHDNSLFMLSHTLCKPGMPEPVMSFSAEQAQQWWGEHVRVFHDDSVLVIRNIGSISVPQDKLGPEIAGYIDVWNLHYAPAAKKLIKHLNREEKTLTLVESYENRACVNRWSYTDRKHRGKTCFPGIQAQKAIFRGDYILLVFDNNLTLLKQQGRQLIKLWTKDLDSSYTGYRELSPNNKPVATLGDSSDSGIITFSHNQSYIRVHARYYGWRLPSVMLISTQDGQIREHSFFAKSNICTRTMIDPKTRYLAVPVGCDFLKGGRKIAQQARPLLKLRLDGNILRVSPDGNVMATRYKGGVYLWRNQATGRKNHE